MSLQGKKVGILVEDLYQEMEVWYPLYRMREAGATVKVLGTGKRDYTSKLGYPVRVDADAADMKPSDLDAIIIPGGYAPDILRRYPEVNGLVKGVFDRGAVVAAICHAGWVLVSAGILRGRKATCFSAIKDDLVNAGAEYLDAEVVVDGNLITSRRPDDLPAFCKAIIAKLGG